MSAYLIVNVEITDPVKYEKYREMAVPTVAQFGGKYLARGGQKVLLEGDWDPTRLIILEFESVEKAKGWWDSDVYAEAKLLRQQSANTQMVIVEGA